MICTIMQPAYLPWLGYFERILLSDLFIVLDDVDIDRNSKTKFANRNRIRKREGAQWLTVPIITKGVSSLRICDLMLDSTARWGSKHFATIQHGYSRAPHFSEHRPFFDAFYGREWTHLQEVCDEVTTYLLEVFKITTPVVKSSTLNVHGNKDELIVNLCREVNAQSYISGPFGRTYLDKESFREAGIELCFHDYVHPVYPQVHGGFEPFMSAIDLLFNCGPRSREVLHVSNVLPRA